MAGADPNTDKPGTVFRFDASADGRFAVDTDGGPGRGGGQPVICPIAVAAESGRLAITTSGNGLVVYD